ncbi:hypothetical protein P152DRAFT_69847 [Eremomyces bilateralis CBS 781.70]|uniref:F-box domain-containing protein n=1 Tax=Eremomyces bilateralis CBS 781.70 TaxID=1392243 RepID=A0A6G1FZY2_9PEZI|nr:uncharacterized protein P152DRAFT_69847 [Eremomyces bilateralis CBS 781.70]KAF1811328.1 hypothetical protein P152DRAFT_69847 [Eremomyces bilateralis CBS 781.70]
MSSYDYLFPAMASEGQLSSPELLTSNFSSLGIVIRAKDVPALDRLGELVASCHNLRTLKVSCIGRITRPIRRNGQVEPFRRPPRGHPWNCQSNECGETLPGLLELELSSFCICGDVDGASYENLPWQQLRRVKFTCPSFLTRFAGQMTHLCALELHLDLRSPDIESFCMDPSCSPSTEDIGQCLRTFTGLKELHLVNGTHLLDETLIAQVGPTVRSISAHQQEQRTTTERIILSKEMLFTIAAMCPNLRSLSVDMLDKSVLVGA